MPTDADTFADQYGPWALVAGASEGVGAAYASAMAARGLNVVLLARRPAVLDEVAAAIRAEAHVETRVVAIDLARDDAIAAILDATDDIDIGMLMYNAGGDAEYEPFLANPVDTALAMVQRNCVVPTHLCHHFGRAMVDRGRGGIVLVSSGAALVGARNMVAYGASKAFDIVMGEALWAEWHDQGVDVLSLVLGATDTPALRRLLAKRGVLAAADDTSAIAGASSAAEVVAEAIENLANGPTWFVGEQLRDGSRLLGGMPRSDAVKAMLAYPSIMDPPAD